MVIIPSLSGWLLGSGTLMPASCGAAVVPLKPRTSCDHVSPAALTALTWICSEPRVKTNGTAGKCFVVAPGLILICREVLVAVMAFLRTPNGAGVLTHWPPRCTTVGTPFESTTVLPAASVL